MKSIIIDTREPIEFAMGHADKAINIPPSEFMKSEVPQVLKGIDRDAPIVLYCRSGQRSNTCATIFARLGIRM